MSTYVSVATAVFFFFFSSSGIYIHVLCPFEPTPRLIPQSLCLSLVSIAPSLLAPRCFLCVENANIKFALSTPLRPAVSLI